MGNSNTLCNKIKKKQRNRSESFDAKVRCRNEPNKNNCDDKGLKSSFKQSKKGSFSETKLDQIVIVFDSNTDQKRSRVVTQQTLTSSDSEQEAKSIENSLFESPLFRKTINENEERSLLNDTTTTKDDLIEKAMFEIESNSTFHTKKHSADEEDVSFADFSTITPFCYSEQFSKRSNQQLSKKMSFNDQRS